MQARSFREKEIHHEDHKAATRDCAADHRRAAGGDGHGNRVRKLQDN